MIILKEIFSYAEQFFFFKTMEIFYSQKRTIN